uniref:MIP17053p n=1 Tax=Drosophila melanogaster TaxID=7227 RepID=D3DMW6_DROME|nr:MIP17053p [Drosophila melanogaster]
MHFAWTGARQRQYGGSTECFGPFTQQNGPLSSTTTHPAGLSPAPCQHPQQRPRPRPRPHRGERRRWQVQQLLPRIFA